MPFEMRPLEEIPQVSDDEITTVVDVAEHLPAKISALRAHGTQVRTWLEQRHDGAGVAALALSNDVAMPVGDREHFVLASGEPEGCATGLFGGLGLSGAVGQP